MTDKRSGEAVQKLLHNCNKKIHKKTSRKQINQIMPPLKLYGFSRQAG